MKRGFKDSRVGIKETRDGVISALCQYVQHLDEKQISRILALLRRSIYTSLIRENKVVRGGNRALKKWKQGLSKVGSKKKKVLFE